MKLRLLLAWAFMALGAALVGWVLLRPEWRLERAPLPLPSTVETHFPIERLERWRWRSREGRRLTFEMVRFKGKWALWVERPQTWRALAEKVKVLERDAVLLSWWHHVGRLKLFTGRPPLCSRPPREAFPEEELEVWRKVADGFEEEGNCLKWMARLWTLPLARALDEIRDRFGHRPVYLLVATEDLLHFGEIERLSGKRLPLEAKRFPAGENFHGRILAVKRWGTSGGGHYLPLKTPVGIIVFRHSGEDLLFLRLLPFLPTEPLPLEPRFESDDHALRLFRLQ